MSISLNYIPKSLSFPPPLTNPQILLPHEIVIPKQPPIPPPNVASITFQHPKVAKTVMKLIDAKGQEILVKKNPQTEKYICPECPAKGFQQAEDLRRHYRIHTGERPFACAICERKFRQRGHLSDHVKRHRKPVDKCEKLLV